MNGPTRDENLDAMLARSARPLRELGELEPLEPLEPPPEVDRFVLASARRALEQPTDSPAYISGTRWALPVTLAATLLLSFAIVLQMDTGTRNPVPAAASEAELARQAREPAATGAARPPGSSPGAPPAAVSPSPALPPERPADGGRATGQGEPAGKSAALPAAPSAARSGAAADATLRSEAAVSEPPEAWLARIEALRGAGRTREAEREWRAFAAAYPDHPAVRRGR